MPSPKVKKGNADKHRNPEADVDDQPDDPVDDDGGDGGGLSLPKLSNKRILALAVIVSAVILILYLRKRAASSSQGALDPQTKAIRDRAKGIDDPDDIDDALSDGGLDPYGLPPEDPNDPLARDEAIIKKTDIFPSLSERFGRGEREE